MYSKMSCSYYEFRSSDYYCHKKSDYVNSDVYNRYCKNYDYGDCPIYKNEPIRSGCYLTTACVVSMNKPDDCVELTALRDLRDNFLAKQENGESEIADYYKYAPEIVRVINLKANCKEIYENIYETVILPCVSKISVNKYEEAAQIYKNSFLALKEKYNN